jgi:hypothetical protein
MARACLDHLAIRGLLGDLLHLKLLIFRLYLERFWDFFS